MLPGVSSLGEATFPYTPCRIPPQPAECSDAVNENPVLESVDASEWNSTMIWLDIDMVVGGREEPQRFHTTGELKEPPLRTVT